MGKRAQQVHSITSVQRALSEDVDDRAKRYAFSMAVRMVCLLLAVVLPDPWRWIALAGAALLPLVAVMVANAGRELPSVAPSDPRAVGVYEGAEPPVTPTSPVPPPMRPDQPIMNIHETQPPR